MSPKAIPASAQLKITDPTNPNTNRADLPAGLCDLVGVFIAPSAIPMQAEGEKGETSPGRTISLR
jgi:hypothetical protein